MQSLNNFSQFELTAQETTNVNGGGRRSRLERRLGRAGRRNLSLLDGSTIEEATDYASYDFAGFDTVVAEQEEAKIIQPEFTADQLAPELVIF